MQAASYDQVIRQQFRFSGVAENDPPPYGKKLPKEGENEESFYEEILQLLEDKYLEDRFAICIEIRKGDEVIYKFPKIACPELFLEGLKIGARKL